MERYFRMGRLSVGSHDRVFRVVVHTKEGERLRKSGGLSYSRPEGVAAGEDISAGYGWTRNCSVCIAEGLAAANAGVPDRLFKRHSRWRSESAKDGYVKNSVEKWLSVSKNLGI